MRIEPKLMLQDIGAPQFWTDYKFWVSTRGNYKNPAEQAIAESIDELVEYAQLGEHGFDYKYVKVIKWDSLFVWPETDDDSGRRLRGKQTITADIVINLARSDGAPTSSSQGRKLLRALGGEIARFFDSESVFYDSPLSAVGIQQAWDLLHRPPLRLRRVPHVGQRL